jgi:putative FmdB family regulatory protein
MPVYEYECGDHGVFEHLRSLAESALPGICPSCEEEAPRVLSVPHLTGVPRATMVAHDRNEQSRHEPRHAHNCGKPRKPDRAASVPGERPALKRYTGARPWVIEHG